MDTNRLRQFCAIAELGSMTKAAKLLHITHSGLSKSMKLLQEELGHVLLRPSGRGLALTEEGLLIYKRAKEFLEYEAQFFKIEKNSVPSMLRIGAVETFLLACKHTSFEHSYISLLDLDPGNMEQLIASKQLDYGITYVPFPIENVEIMEIGRYRLGCYHLKGAFAGKKFSEIPFVVPARGLSSNPLGIRERDGWHDSIYPRNKKYSVNLLSTAIELTLQGLCAVYMPDFVARKYKNRLVEYALPRNQKNIQQVFLLKHQDQVEDGTFRLVYRMVKDVVAGK